MDSTPPKCSGNFRHLADDVRTQARHRWPDVLSAVAGISRESLNGRPHPCPKCGGADRFCLIDAEAGAVMCRKCFATGNGDGIAAVAWMTGKQFGEVIDQIGDYLGLTPQNGNKAIGIEDPIEAVCRAKRMPLTSALAYGAHVVDGAGVFPMFGPDGKQCSEFSIWPTGGELRRKGLSAKGKKAGVFLPVVDGSPRLPQPSETWLVFEGVKDAAAAHSLGYLAAGLNTCNMAQKFAKLFRGVNVVFVPDRDAASIDGFTKSARRLLGVAASVKIAALPAAVLPSGGKDFRDILAQADGEGVAREAIDQAQPFMVKAEGEGVDNRPRIFAGPKEHEVASHAIAALSVLPGLYQRGGALASIVADPEPPAGIKRPPGTLYICQIDEHGICDRLSQAARFYQVKRQGEELAEVDVVPPMRIARIVQSRRVYPAVPTIEGILHAPAFLADGSVLATRGFDRRTGLYLAGNVEFPAVPQSPTEADAERARDELLEVVCDFPFASDAHKSAWFALMLTPTARFAFDGPVPLGAFDANVRGSGKSKLADSIGMVHLGTDMPRTAWAGSDEEFRKQATAVLLAGERLMLLDNVNTMLGCGSLDALLTATGWNERILGFTKMTGRIAASTQWLASGNNLVFGADTSRRSLVCRIESPEENPEEREGFKHPYLIEWVKANRARLAVAAVTILRAYHVAGRPKMGLPEWGSFECWSNLVRNAVVWLGMDDPGATRQEVRDQSDREAGIFRQLLAAWDDADAAGFGMTVQEAIGKAAGGNQNLQAVFAEIGTPGKPPNSRSISMKIHHMRGRIAGGKYFSRLSGPNHTVSWRVDAAGQGESGDGSQGSSGSKGTKPKPPTRAHAHAHTRSDGPEPSSSPLTTSSTPAADDEEAISCER